MIISDDGLQHYSLHRDVELCVVGAQVSETAGCSPPVPPASRRQGLTG
ncbi:MAG: tetraacyldisaccharide 4'-kinase [Dakarella massiliensis]